jgi:tetratricopeptide (TPR) repeat protein
MRIPILVCCVLFLGTSSVAFAVPPLQVSPNPAIPTMMQWFVQERLPLTGLLPAKHFPGICHVQYGVSTTSPVAQQFINQGLGYYYSYVWIEAARSFETALLHDPKSAFAWMGLSKAIDKWRDKPADKKAGEQALRKAEALLPQASHREQLLIRARLQEMGLIDNLKAEERKKKAVATLDELLTIYDDDQEGWFARAQLAEGVAASVPFYKSLLRLNPIHPGASHELVHFYEGYKRPALGWPHALAYMQSSPGIPHAFHMQSHLAMRIGKWEKTTDNSVRAIEMQLQYHTEQQVDPKDDHQFQHHLETLTRSLVHDGRYTEAKRIQEIARKHDFSFSPEWVRMSLTQSDWAGAEAVIRKMRDGKNKIGAAYFAALVRLEQDDQLGLQREVDNLRHLQQLRSKFDRTSQNRLMEMQGRLLCLTGSGPQGLKLIKKVVDATKADFGHHAWGFGAYYMESWGIAALDAGNATEAEEAFLEALAHDAGSVRGALGMWALCKKLGRDDEAENFLQLSRRIWINADSVSYENVKRMMQRKAEKLVPVVVGIPTNGAGN